MTDNALEIRDLSVSYGSAHALESVSLTLQRGEVLALIGANGAGKSTLFKAVCGMVRAQAGEIVFGGTRIDTLSASEIVGRGVAMVPEGRRLFRSLTVEENLIIGGQVGRPGPWSLERVYQVFPVLEQRRRQPATSLSGGQQQMVAIGRALMSNPEVLLMDELSLGLAPVIIKDIYELMPRILGDGLSAIIVEQDIGRAMKVSHRFACMLEGRISLSGRCGEYTREQISAAYFGN
ncbi:MAG: ABC transporter ATP-binding protein [Burkholderiaceae bacterium]